MLNITIRRSVVVAFQIKNNVSKQPDLMVFSTAQEAPADWIFASKYICLFLWTFHGTTTCFNWGSIKKKMRDWSLPVDLLSFSFPWTDSYRLVAFMSEINTVNDLLLWESLCIPLSIIARSHRWLLCRDVDKETTQTSWIGTDQEVVA